MNEKSTAKNFSYVSIGKITTTFLQALFYIIFASILVPEQYGTLSITVALAGTFSVFSRFGLNHTLQIYRAKNDSKISEQINTLFILSTTVAALILVMIDPFAAILCIAMSFFAMNLQNLLGLKSYKQFMISTILKSLLLIFISLGLYFIFDIPGILIGMAIGLFIGSYDYFKHLKIRSFFELKNNYKIIIHNFGVDSAGSLSFMIDKLLIAFLFSAHIVGIYQFSLQVFLALGVLPNILFSFLLTEESSGTSHKKLSYLVILGSIIVTIITIVLAPLAVQEFFPKYSEGVLGLQIMSISVIPASIQAILNAKLMSRESTKVGFSAIVRISTLLILIAILGQLYGLVGLSLAVLTSIIANVVFSFLLLKKSQF